MYFTHGRRHSQLNARPVAGGGGVVTLAPGIPVNSPAYWPEQRIEQVRLTAATG